MKKILFPLTLTLALTTMAQAEQPGIVVYQSDFGLKDGAVSAMHGVAIEVDKNLVVEDLTHEIPAYNIWEASYRLMQTMPYWPEGTVFVSVVDPGVGTDRKSVVLKTKTGQFVVTPDNGTLTLVAEHFGIDEVRQIDEAVNRRKDSEKSYTFHGRDVYSFTGARLAANKITFEEVGELLPAEVWAINYQTVAVDNGKLMGNIPILDPQYGNVWTSIPGSAFADYEYGDIFAVEIKNNNEVVYTGEIPYVSTFGDVPDGTPLIYLNSLLDVSIALNMDNFSEVNKVYSGPEWSITLERK
ncbi:MAG: S-adenosyl-l-methionine hydroxide adenosyltransferase family protein [Alphaproteobacteria bacterium]